MPVLEVVLEELKGCLAEMGTGLKLAQSRALAAWTCLDIPGVPVGSSQLHTMLAVGGLTSYGPCEQLHVYSAYIVKQAHTHIHKLESN